MSSRCGNAEFQRLFPARERQRADRIHTDLSLFLRAGDLDMNICGPVIAEFALSRVDDLISSGKLRVLPDLRQVIVVTAQDRLRSRCHSVKNLFFGEENVFPAPQDPDVGCPDIGNDRNIGGRDLG